MTSDPNDEYRKKFEAHETLPPDDEDGQREYEEWMEYFEELENREKRREWY